MFTLFAPNASECLSQVGLDAAGISERRIQNRFHELSYSVVVPYEHFPFLFEQDAFLNDQLMLVQRLAKMASLSKWAQRKGFRRTPSWRQCDTL